jgi:Xaa-Pro aminopeptidase
MDLEWHGDHVAAQFDRDPGDDLIDLEFVRHDRLRRVRTEMDRHGVDAVLLFDPVNIRYATDSRNMQIFTARNGPSRYAFIPLDGPVVLFEFTGCEHLAAELTTIDEVRPAMTASYVAAGDAIAQTERAWAASIAELIRQHCGPTATVGVERMNAGAAIALANQGFTIVDAQQPVERARAVKSDEELKCIRSSIRATERGVAALRDAIRPGLTEQQLWSVLHQAVIAQGGDYVETRLLNSGTRTNPWFQEASQRVIEANELIALDTDVVGCFGYYADFSRTFHAGPDEPTAQQRELYAVAHEQVHHNMGIIAPGVSFKEYSERAWDIPAEYENGRYYLSAHGVGMTGEYPYLYHRRDYDAAGYDGVFVPNMTICVESYIGHNDGGEGVKLEQHCLVTETGLESLSSFPFEDALLAG